MRTGLAAQEAAEVHRRDAVDVLGGVDGVDGGGLVQVGRQGELEEDGVEARVFVHVHDVGVELVLGDGVAEVKHLGEDAGLLCGVALGADVGDGGGVFADEDEGEAGGNASPGQLASALGYLSAELLGDGAAVDDLGGSFGFAQDRHAGI
jgi:hypothetical protein